MLQQPNLKVNELSVTEGRHSTAVASFCSLAADAVWAAMDTYAPSADSSYQVKLKEAFWTQAASWAVTNETTPDNVTSSVPFGKYLKDTDYASLWERYGECVMAFRGSDSQIDVDFLGPYAPAGYGVRHTEPGAPNGIQWSDVDFHGLQVHLGVKVELEAILAKLQSTGGLATMKETCTAGLTLTGHSLGGGTSQLLATLLNKNGDPLGANLTVDHIYGFGPMPFVKNTPAANDKSADGCFAGGMYANAEKKNAEGIPVVDLVWQMLTATPGLQFKHVKTAHHIMISPSEEMVTPCGEDAPYPYTGKTVKTSSMMPAHDQNLYVNNTGCPVAYYYYPDDYGGAELDA